MWGDHQVQAPEFTLSDNQGHRLPRGPALDKPFVGRPFIRAQRLVITQVEVDPL
jgi:hypothetical protein